MADELGAVRRTPRPTGDRQTPETVAQLPRGATNAPTPVSADAGNGTDDLSPDWRCTRCGAGRWVGWRAGPEHEGWPRKAQCVPCGHVQEPPLSPDFAAALIEHHGPEIQAIADAFHELRGKLHATAVLGHVHTTDNDMQAFLELPDCTACGGTGKDDHGTPFEAPLAVHFAGPPVKAERRVRQLCMWCGHVLIDVALTRDTEPPEWPTGALVRVEDGLDSVVPHEPGAELPPGCCALPDDEDQAPAEQSAPPAPNPWVRCPNTPPCEHPSLIHDVSGDPEDPKPMCCADGCRCGQPDDGPDEAQETPAAADWPAEPVDTPAEGDHV